MAAEQKLMQVVKLASTKTTKAVIMAIREADSLGNVAIPVQAIPRTGSPVLKLPAFN